MYMTKMLAGRDDDLEYTNVLRLIGMIILIYYFLIFLIMDPVIPKQTDWSFIDHKQVT